ncbi:serine protease [Sorangium sp. So ce321]|uniref:serine protease n=1 Tax=Sorangium sp. So ce321 TaxID=3133300 RepID=UPI003F5E7ABE
MNAAIGLLRHVGGRLILIGASCAIASCADGAEDEDEGDLIGESSDPVIGGTPAPASYAPWQTRIIAYKSDGTHLCGGTLLPDPLIGGSQSRYVVTAAHCIYDDGIVVSPSALDIVAGDRNRVVTEATEQVRFGAEIVPHPSYDAGTGRNDIAIVRMNSPVTFGSSVQPIEMPDGRYMSTDTETVTATITGWGVTETGDISSVLLKADLPIVDQATCAPAMATWGQVLPTMICAGYANGVKGGCFGDSGGPLTATNEAGHQQLAGIVSWGSELCSTYTVFTRAVDYVPWIRSITSTQPFACQGQTPPGYTDWQQDGADHIFLDVNTTQCNFPADPAPPPAYFTSLGGSSGHFTSLGATSIYSATSTGFRVNVKKSGITPAQANSWKWHLNWQGASINQNQNEMCTGRTTPGATSWVQYNTRTVLVDVDTTRCNRTSKPRYFTSLGGSGYHWTTFGTNNIYLPTKDGFRVYVVQDGITPAIANQRNWHINWASTPPAAQTNLNQCTGSTAPGSNWVQSATDSVYLEVNTSSCQRTVTPLYFASLRGQSSFFSANGVTSIYKPTPTGFRVYLSQPGLTAADAAARQYSVDWGAYR